MDINEAPTATAETGDDPSVADVFYCASLLGVSPSALLGWVLASPVTVATEERWFVIPVNADDISWKPRSTREDAEALLWSYPPEWTYWGEEHLGPNGLKGLRGETRQVWTSPWVEVA